MKTKVQVTQEDIDFGTPASAFGCAMGRAIARALQQEALLRYIFHGVVPSSTGGAEVCIRDMRMNTTQYYPLPPECGEFLMKYDHRDPVEPFEFELEVSL